MVRGFRQDDGAQGARVYRRDRASVTGSRRTEAGFLVAQANIAKTGPLRYLNADGTERIELVLADELFAEKSLASFRSAPIVLIHPAEKVLTPDNARRLSVGWPADVRPADDGEHVEATLTITDAGAIRAIEDGVRELSPGYFCDLEPIEGGVFTMPDGSTVRADFIQRNRTHNHIAIEPEGRSGPTVSIRLDSAGNVITEPGRTNMEMVKINIGGTEYEVPKAVAEALLAAQAKATELDSQKAAAAAGAPAPEPKMDAAEVARLRRELESAKGEAAGYKGQLETARARLDAHEKAQAAAEQAALVERVAGVLGVKATELAHMDRLGVQKHLVEKLAPTVKLDGKGAEYVAGVFETVIASASTPSPTNANHLRNAQRTDAGDDVADPTAAHFAAWSKGAPKLA